METQTPVSKSLEGACSIFLQDLQALPEEAFTMSFGPKVRTVADIVFEVNMVNDHVCMALRSEEVPAWPHGDWIKAPADFNTKEIVTKAFRDSSGKAMETVGKLSIGDLATTVMTEHGERTREQQSRFMGLHIWYHSGQLNFIQTLLGDDGWHWK